MLTTIITVQITQKRSGTVSIIMLFLFFDLPLQANMSGMKRKIEGNDPDYDDISLVQSNKRNKTAEHDGELIF